jgi:hypothetical protein
MRYAGAVTRIAVLFCGLSLMGMRLETAVPIDSSTTRTETTSVFAYPQPPHGFRALSASDAELAKYGFPPRPDPQKTPALYEQWRRMVSVPRAGRPIMRSTKIYNGTAQLSPRGEKP